MNLESFQEIITIKEDGRMKHRESKKLEFKANFNFGSMHEYSKTFAAFANSAGGVIVFGVKDSPRNPSGMSNDNLLEVDPERITNYLNEHFSPEMEWEMFDFEVDGNTFGVVLINESRHKPVVCKKETRGQKARESDIFYRYSGRSERIKFPELQNLLEENRQIERRKWMEHIQNIAKIGPQNIMLMDIMRGEIPNENNTKIIVDKELLKEIKFIQEGRFVERDGAPALKLIGSVEGAEAVAPNFNLDDDFYSTKELGDKLGLLSDRGSTSYMTTVIRKYNIQDDTRYYQHKGNQKLYSKLAYDFLASKNLSLEDAKEISREYYALRKGQDGTTD